MKSGLARVRLKLLSVRCASQFVEMNFQTCFNIKLHSAADCEADMKKRILLAVIAALMIPYIVTLAWTGTVVEEIAPQEIPSGRKILLDRGNNSVYVDLEEYLIGIVGQQIPADYGNEALRAQAIIARTYIYAQMGDGTEIAESALDLDYLEEKQLKELWGPEYFAANYEQIVQAVKSTAGTVIKYNESCIVPLFHRASAGKTRQGDELHPYLQSVDCPADVEAEGYLTAKVWSKEEFAGIINEKAGENVLSPDQLPSTIQLVSKDQAGYVEQMQIGGKTYSGEELQAALGILSPCFTLEEYEGKIRAVSKGIGHGYGLCQYGAKKKAEEGWTAEDILGYFYKDVTIGS